MTIYNVVLTYRGITIRRLWKVVFATLNSRIGRHPRKGYREAWWNRDLRPRREYAVRREEYAGINISFSLFVGFVLT